MKTVSGMGALLTLVLCHLCILLTVPQLIYGGNVDFLVFDYLSEITMSLLTAAKAKVPVSEKGCLSLSLTLSLTYTYTLSDFLTC